VTDEQADDGFVLSKPTAWDGTTDSISLGRVGGGVSIVMSRIGEDGFNISGPMIDLSQGDCLDLAVALLRFWVTTT
jgi:hypothetical protein